MNKKGHHEYFVVDPWWTSYHPKGLFKKAFFNCVKDNTVYNLTAQHKKDLKAVVEEVHDALMQSIMQ
eukprot:6027373-Ditylum_brightwellii.AAC.1